MKICILSMQRVLNYGSLLQAYSLKKMIESLGHRVSFIDIIPDDEDNQKRKSVVEYSEERKLSSNNLLSRIKHQDSCLFWAILKAVNKKRVAKEQTEFAHEVLMLNEASNEQVYDTCVIGSDEVFNCMNNASWGFTTQLFGNVKQASKVITYAASCGFTSYDMLSSEVKEAIQTAFQRIAAFSVRDSNTKHFVEKLTGMSPRVNLDPVAVGDFEKEIAAIDIQKKLPKRSCIIYAYHDRINSEEEIQTIKNFCRSHNLTPVTIGGFQKWVKRHLALSPFEVLAAFRNAECVITDTFHGTLFSAKYAKRFAVIVRESNRNKLTDLMTRLGIETHELDRLEELEQVMQQKPNRAVIDGLLETERKKTLTYLENNL